MVLLCFAFLPGEIENNGKPQFIPILEGLKCLGRRLGRFFGRSLLVFRSEVPRLRIGTLEAPFGFPGF